MNRISFDKTTLITMRKNLTDEEIGNIIRNVTNYWLLDDDGCDIISEKACLMYDILCADVDYQKSRYEKNERNHAQLKSWKDAEGEKSW